MGTIGIINVRIATESEIIENGSLCIEDGRITAIHKETTVYTKGTTILDGQDKLLIPGMMDVHIHGANGYDMMDGTKRSIQEVSKTCAASGCTSFLATSVSSKLEALLHMIDNVKQVMGHEEGL